MLSLLHQWTIGLNFQAQKGSLGLPQFFFSGLASFGLRGLLVCQWTNCQPFGPCCKIAIPIPPPSTWRSLTSAAMVYFHRKRLAKKLQALLQVQRGSVRDAFER